ncbi:hypothetical protein [Aeromicrobium sp. 9AM]|uniref:hypothetical protein n=1 Tax=Aeromicrobium sp. 9AM TaxID=2653126 RepID=UPI00135B2535|nr:hypothetical protein [Aeromicrobium sp. 9AM]
MGVYLDHDPNVTTQDDVVDGLVSGWMIGEIERRDGRALQGFTSDRVVFALTNLKVGFVGERSALRRRYSEACYFANVCKETPAAVRELVEAGMR